MSAGDAGLERQAQSECEFDPDDLYHNHREADALRAQLDRLQAQLAAQQAVVDAAVGVLNCVSHGGQEAVWHHQADGACLDVLDRALDKAQAAQPEGEQA